MSVQSLYRRFRPQRFAEVVGQPHLVRALRNAVREGRVGHAYLLSGPRGTGKTSTARILAKALNCDALGDDGEPCDACERCRSVTAGTSMDLIELDAASHNSVNHIRDLTEKAALVSAGRRKVYLLDEVHMLSAAASNALLKTLEEPPPHVVFILATTDPHKVLPTIRSRTQQFELALVGADEMAAHMRTIAQAADVSADERTIDYIVESGNGSVRDALSAFDTVLAAGGIPDERADIDALVAALTVTDLAATLAAVAGATAAGVDARDLAERTARRLRDMFLASAGVAPAELSSDELALAREQADAMGRRANVRALEALGGALAQMPQSADRRLTLEAALVGLLADEVLGAGTPLAPTAETGRAPTGPAAARAAMASTQAPPSLNDKPAAVSQRSSPAPTAPVPPPPTPPPVATTEALVEAASEPSAPPAVAAAEPQQQMASESASMSAPPSTAEDLQRVWETQIVGQLRPVAAGMFRNATVLAHERNVVTVRLSAGVPVAQARRRANEVQPILSNLLDSETRLEISDLTGKPDETPNFGDETPTSVSDAADLAVTSLGETETASPSSASPSSASPQEAKVQRIVDRFPGAVVVQVDESTT